LHLLFPWGESVIDSSKRTLPYQIERRFDDTLATIA